MARTRLGAVLSAVTFLVTAISLSLADQPPGLEKKGKVPPGFSQGKKQGWDSLYPPGWDHKSAKEKQKWKEAVEEGEQRISKHAKRKGMSEYEVESALEDYEKAVRKGLEPEESESIVKDKIGKGHRGKPLSDEIAQESEKHLKHKNKYKKNKKGNKG